MHLLDPRVYTPPLLVPRRVGEGVEDQETGPDDCEREEESRYIQHYEAPV
jgi:hypothetical protein